MRRVAKVDFIGMGGVPAGPQSACEVIRPVPRRPAG
jgi:hypothetical protein